MTSYMLQLQIWSWIHYLGRHRCSLFAARQKKRKKERKEKDAVVAVIVYISAFKKCLL